MTMNMILFDGLMTVLGCGLTVAILVRSLQRKLTKRYPIFYLYILILVGLHIASPLTAYFVGAASNAYYEFYWFVLYAALLAEALILLDVVAHDQLSRLVFLHSPVRFFRRSIVAAIILCLPILGAATLQVSSQSLIAMARDLYALWAGVLSIVLCAAAYFAVPMGKNRKGMLLGLGLEWSSYVICFSLLSYFHSEMGSSLANVLPVVDVIVYLIWLVSLWSYHPDPIPDVATIRAALREPLPKRFHRLGLSVLAYLSGLFRAPRNA